MAKHQDFLMRRGLFVGLNLCVFVSAYLLAIRPVVSLLSDQADRLAQARAALSNYRTIAARDAAVRSKAARAGDAASSSAFLQGASDGGINADLQARLKTVADQAGARVQSVRALEPGTDRDTRYLGAHLELTGSIAAIYTTLQTIEGREPYLFVDTATLRMPATPPGAVPTQEPSIEAQFDIYGPLRNHAVGR
ncbi:general secretion pathway protein M [Bradyrhizobium sp. AZCC 1678]|uniref:type II secretion system protein GspM n=1 Tax=Bradyrhizobium sp. AZCC 1678 TaxID=3117030 RepID=UPI002FF330DA